MYSMRNINEDCCAGCTITHVCNLPIIEDHKKCPCQECLIKIMCNSECDDFSDYHLLCHKENNEERSSKEKQDIS
jgi:hypothetical protein